MKTKKILLISLSVALLTVLVVVWRRSRDSSLTEKVRLLMSPLDGNMANVYRERFRDLVSKYSPIHQLPVDTSLYPISYEYLYPYFNYNEKLNRLDLKPEFDKGSHYRPDWVVGDISGGAPCYISLTPHPEGFRIDFWYVFAYNLPKNISILGKKTALGAHYLDHTHSHMVWPTEVLSNGWPSDSLPPPPIRFGHQAHKERYEYGFDKYPLSKEFESKFGHQPMMKDGRMRFFHASRGSEVYPTLGKVTYEKIGPVKLTDHMSEGMEMRPWLNYVAVMPEHWTGESNMSFDQDGLPVSLKTPFSDNWAMLSYIGADASGSISLKPFSNHKLEKRSGFNRVPFDKFREDYGVV